MIYKIIPVVFIILIFAFYVNAEEKIVFKKCGGTKIKIVALTYPDSHMAYKKVTLTATSKNKNFQMIFDESKQYRRGEYFQVGCVEGKDKLKYIVFQNICGGSGCNSVGNYGIIDSENLKVMLMPDDLNKDKAVKILGRQPPYSFNILDY